MINWCRCIYIFFVSCCFFTCSNTNKNYNEKLVFRYNEHKNISSLDPAFAKDNANIWAVNQLFNGLVQMDNKLHVIPAIAKNWTISTDALVYNFNLKKNVFYHKHEAFGKDSTRQVIAKDFEYSFNRLIDKQTASPGSWVLNKVAYFKALNDSIFQIKLKQPFPAFLGLLSMQYCSVVPKEIVSLYKNNFRAHPIGTGPFKFKRWEENIKLVFRKNNLYFECDKNNNRLPYLEAIAITFLPDKQSEFLQFAQGNIDFISGLDASYKDELLSPTGQLKPRYSKSTRIIRGPYLNTEYLGFLMDSKNKETQSLLIRKAINYGFDRQKMITYLRNGIGIPANGGFIPKGLPGYNANVGYNYQPEKAKQLIKQYKTETGHLSPSVTITTTGNYLSFCEYIQRELQKTGLLVNINVTPASTLKNGKAQGKLELFRASWIADYPDAENYLSLYYSNNFTPNGPNYTHYKNEKFDRWYKKAYLETSIKKREVLYKKMDSLVMTSAPIIPLFYDEVVRFTSKKIKGLENNPTNLLNLKYVIKN